MGIVGRKLCLHCMQEIESNEIEQIPTFAEAKTTEIFKHILNGGPNKIFIKDPISEFDAAQHFVCCLWHKCRSNDHVITINVLYHVFCCIVYILSSETFLC